MCDIMKALLEYPKTTLVQRQQGKPYYVQCTIPPKLRPLFKNQTQIRKSTSTSDRRLAERLKHQISQIIYNDFEAALQKGKRTKTEVAKHAILSFVSLIGYKAIAVSVSHSHSETDNWLDSYAYADLVHIKRQLDLIAEYNRLMAFDWLEPLKDEWSRSAFDKFRGKGDDHPEKLKMYNVLQRYRENDVSDYWEITLNEAFKKSELSTKEPHNNLRQVQLELYMPSQQDEFEPYNIALPKDGLDDPDTHGNRTSISMDDVLEDYIKSKTWNREKTKKTAIRHLKIISDILENPTLTSLTSRDAIDVSKTIIRESRKDDGSVIKLATLKDIISNMSVFMRYCVREGYCDLNVFTGLDLQDLGADETVDSYVPFSKAELHQLFEITMPDQDRLLLSILTVTGMRLDEAALLTWEQVQEEDGISFLSLLDDDENKVIVKTKGSLRRVPLPDVLTLPERATGRLFSYKLDADGKAQKEASKQLMRHVRRVSKMRTKAVHSLRGTFKDLLRDADVSKELNDFITGHAAGDVAGKYGSGFSLQRRYEAINSVQHPWLK